MQASKVLQSSRSWNPQKCMQSVTALQMKRKKVRLKSINILIQYYQCSAESMWHQQNQSVTDTQSYPYLALCFLIAAKKVQAHTLLDRPAVIRLQVTLALVGN